MRNSFFSKNVPFLFIGCALIVILCATAIRFAPNAAPESGLPAFTSARFESGDVIESLGPEWTLVRQTDLRERSVSLLPGTASTRETFARLIGGSATLLVTELRIVDATMFADALAVPEVTQANIAGRTGYIVRPPSYAGGSGFLIPGSATALLLQYGEEQFQDMMNWPQTIPSAIQTYIGVVPVH